MRIALIAAMAILLNGCYSIPQIDGFDKDQWMSEITNCEENKLDQAQLLIDQVDKLYSEGEAEIKGLLGSPDEHELYQRNQKFFYYNLTLKDCPEPKRLSLRFDALDRLKEVLIIEW